jgi:tRNA U34 5-methylaminomethyl-2-thiouridine-forming methyltransferase MnmC
MKRWHFTMDDQKILKSDDGSDTILSEKFGVTYHSTFGAVDESITVFLSAGLQYHLLRGRKKIRIFEMGFGTGLNAFLTLLESKKHPETKMAYSGIELYPIKPQQATQLNYPQYLSVEKFNNEFLAMHKCPFDEWQHISDAFKFRKFHKSILEIELDQMFDLIYYDAFAPTTQEELWTPAITEKMYAHTNPGGVLVTYCAKGSFKRALKSAGYNIESLPGPTGKREMTRAIRV